MLQGHKRDWGVGDLPTPRCSPTSSFARKEASAFSISWPRHPAALSTKANMPLRDLDSGMATVPLHFASTMDSTLNLRHRIRQQVVPTIFESTKMTGPSDSTSYAVSTIAVLRPGRSLFFSTEPLLRHHFRRIGKNPGLSLVRVAKLASGATVSPADDDERLLLSRKRPENRVKTNDFKPLETCRKEERVGQPES